ncbi:MAG: HesA/MoeB/ThiF family protein [Bacteroidaceae bacterium]|nr:HesA/MoeB/ThiF family protein [Bacteroidaceae bacterium]
MNNRYSRHIMLPDIGCEGQTKLSQARVLVVGVGGLGSPISLYLTAAGVGHIGIIDNDVVSHSNLQRQVLYHEADVGKDKVHCAYTHLHSISSHTSFNIYPTRLDSNNAASIITDYDIVVDGCDNADTRYTIDDVCALQGKPYVYGAINEYCGQVSVFDARYNWRYSQLYPDRTHAISQPDIINGVVATLPGIIGTIQATEVIKLITGVGDSLIQKLFMIDIRTMESNTINFKELL